jgi:hypothetical protein
MTDQDVIAVLDRLESLLGAPLDRSDARAVADWHEAFKRAVAGAERGSRWPEVQARAKVLGRLLSRRMALLQAAQDALRQDLAKVASGRKALAAYRNRP